MKWIERLVAVAFTLLLAVSLIPHSGLFAPVEAQQVSLVGDTDKICVVAQAYPGADKYGFLSVNPDGTFYPGDKLWIKYDVYTFDGFSFEGVEAVYNETAFVKLGDLDWGKPSGMASFMVKPEAKPGTYAFTIKAWGSSTCEGASGSLTVTFGGASVDAYYATEYLLTIANASGGTTNPAPGSYWCIEGVRVSVTALPDANYTLDYWILDGNNAGSANPITILMDSPHTLTPVFKSQKSTSVSSALSSPAEPKLVIRDLNWKTWFDILRGTVCQATGYLYSSDGRVIPNSDVVVEFRKKNFWTGAVWVASKTVKTDGWGYFIAEDTCNPLAEQFLGVKAWAEKAGYIPSWSLWLSLNPTTASVGKGGGFIVGVKVWLDGRYTPVSVSLSASGLPPGCTASFNPEAGIAEWGSPLQSAMLLKVQPDAEVGSYAFTVAASSGAVVDSKRFTLEVTEPPHIPSQVTFKAHGLDADASGLALTLDGSEQVYADQLPYTATWEVHTQHTYVWSASISSTVAGKRYVLEKAVATTKYASIATVSVEVVEYDPHFTLVLAYPVPSSPGNDSYQKHFAMIIRYDGNGPEKNLGQRAVIEGWDWDGYGMRIRYQQELTGLTEISNVEDLLKNLDELMKLFNLTRAVQFSVAGIDAETEGTILKVDGESLTFEQLPKSYSWPENTTHTYEWSVRMPVYAWVTDWTGLGYYVELSDEWFSFQYAQVQVPQIKVKENATVEELKQVALNFSQRLYSPKGTINATSFGNRVTGVYSHNRLLTSIAGDAGVRREDALKLLEPRLPVFFNNESRYAKFVFDLDDRVAEEAVNQAYNSSIFYEISFWSNLFTPHTFKANFTCPFEYYRKHVDFKAVRWDPVGKRWVLDAVRIEALFNVAFNFTEEDAFKSYLKDQTADETALKMASEDFYECLPQYYGGIGECWGILNRTSPYYYNLNVTSGHAYPYYGVAPEDRDAWTEKVKSAYAVWTSPSCTVSADANRKTAGSASIRVDASDVATACAVLNLIKPVEAWGKLTFDVYLGEGFTGNLTVVLQHPYARVSMWKMVPVGAWSTVSFNVAGTGISKVGIYAELSKPSASFWIDRLHFTEARLWRWTDKVEVAGTVYVNFASNATYVLYVNFDPLSPLNVNVTSDDVKRSSLTLEAPPQLGGLKNLTVYLVTSAPTGYNIGNLPIERLKLKPILSMNLTSKREAVPSGWYYEGSAPITAGSTLGFEGSTSFEIYKDPEFRALPGYNSTLLLVEAKNIWGTTFRTVVSVQPWGKTFWEIVFEQVATALVGLAIAAVIISLIIHLFKGRVP